jgi:hypothetical protein
MRRCRDPLLLAVLLAPALAIPGPSHAEDWPPIDPADLAATRGQVDPDAGAELLDWEVQVEDRIGGHNIATTIRSRLRIKVYNQRGIDQASRMDLTYLRPHVLDEISARTVPPDGREIRLRRADVFERTVLKGAGYRLNAMSFVFPAVEAGAVLDCRWREVRFSDMGMTGAYPLQRDLPARRVTYHFKPILGPGGLAMRFTTFHATAPPPQSEGGGSYVMTAERVPAFHEEPYMPPEMEVRGWVLADYTDAAREEPGAVWRELGRAQHEYARDAMRPDRAIRDAAVAIVGGTVDSLEQLRRLHDFCRREIRNLDAPGTPVDEKAPRNAREVLAQRKGTPAGINELFGALARSLGHEVRLARCADRGRGAFDRSAVNPYMLSARNVAVRLHGTWRFFDPGSRLLPFGCLRWQEEGVEALVGDPDSALWVRTPVRDARGSCARHVGVFELSADGSLTGNARTELTGHMAVEERGAYEDMSDEERAQTVRDAVRDWMPTAVVGDVAFTNLGDPDRPLVVAYHLTVPSYAEATGSRLFFQPAVFQHGRRPAFSATVRRHPLDFHYVWSELDSLLIRLPAGWALEAAEMPGDLRAGDFGRYSLRVGIANQGTVVVYRRAFQLERARFPRTDYARLKEFFDATHENDDHALAIRRPGP